MKNKREFCCTILTNRSQDQIKTINALRRCGYDGDIYIITDDENENKYNIEGVEALYFNKKEIAKKFDTYDNFENYKAIVYARNAVYDCIRENTDYRYFIQLADDYNSFSFRLDNNDIFKCKGIDDINLVFEGILEMLKTTRFSSISIGQGGDYIGGATCGIFGSDQRQRKCMNSFFCDIEDRVIFNGTINEDVNTYTLSASRGLLMLTIPRIGLNQANTQTTKGGMTDIYLEGGTYIKSFYSVMAMPSAVKVKTLRGGAYTRLHHRISWKNAIPKIIDKKFKKD